ncbi:MAG TPA: hypothetical protein VK489_10285 [Ferruginibacter sp.]|nr:hypothetical protein [Ferruginibacter sp.]
MDTSAFVINFQYDNKLTSAEIRPCCREDNIVDYAVWIDDKLLFTITRDSFSNGHWVVALKNADDEFDDKMIQSIGSGIDSREM